MLQLVATTKFRKDNKRIKKLGYDTSLLENVIDTPFSLIRTILILSLNFSLSN